MARDLRADWTLHAQVQARLPLVLVCDSVKAQSERSDSLNHRLLQLLRVALPSRLDLPLTCLPDFARGRAGHEDPSGVGFERVPQSQCPAAAAAAARKLNPPNRPPAARTLQAPGCATYAHCRCC